MLASISPLGQLSWERSRRTPKRPRSRWTNEARNELNFSDDETTGNSSYNGTVVIDKMDDVFNECSRRM
jgi:hypothetical protein